MDLAPAVFWCGTLLAGYTYAGYPALLACLTRARVRETARMPLLADEQLPEVTVVMAAYNEAARLPDKLRNLRALDYPAHLLQVLVVSDGSTDGTERCAEGLPGVRVLAGAQRRGKACALNLALREVHTDYVVFCDVRQSLEAPALRWLISDLQDPRVGVVGGQLQHRPARSAVGRNIGLYWRYETWIRAAESRLHSTVGASGALYAMRRRDWQELRAGAICDDFDTPMQVLRRGLRVVFEPRAVAWDTLQEDVARERGRKVRTLSGNFQSFAAHPWLFSPRANPVWWQFVSHKVLRLFVPYALASALLASALADGTLYLAAFAAQLLFYAAAVLGRWWPRARSLRLVSLAHVFCDLNLAAVLALGRFARGRLDARWEKTS